MISDDFHWAKTGMKRGRRLPRLLSLSLLSFNAATLFDVGSFRLGSFRVGCCGQRQTSEGIAWAWRNTGPWKRVFRSRRLPLGASAIASSARGRKRNKHIPTSLFVSSLFEGSPTGIRSPRSSVERSGGGAAVHRPRAGRLARIANDRIPRGFERIERIGEMPLLRAQELSARNRDTRGCAVMQRAEAISYRCGCTARPDK